MRFRSFKQFGKCAAITAFLMIKPLVAKAQVEEKTNPPPPVGTETGEDSKAEAAPSDSKEQEEKPKEEPKDEKTKDEPEDPGIEIEIDSKRKIKFDEKGNAPVTQTGKGSSESELPKVDEIQPNPDHDTYVGIYNPNISMNGKLRNISLEHVWDIGGNVVSNEAGSSVYGALSHRFATKDNIFATRVNLNAGNIWFGEQAAPFLRAFASPELNLWRFRATTYTSLALMADMPSWIYLYQSAGIGYSQKFDDNMRLRFGAVGGFAISAPAYDNMFANFTLGTSFEIQKHLIYTLPRFYFAASDPIKVAYYDKYSPRFQGIESGFQVTFYEDQYAARIFLDIDRLYQRFGGRITRTINFSDTVTGDIYGGVGFSHYIKSLGGRWDPVALAGISITVGGKYINSTNSFRYEHLTSGGIQQIETDFPTKEDPGPYGFGRAGTENWRNTVNTAKERLLSANSLSEFSSSYEGSSNEEVIRTARFLGAFMQQAAYANKANEDLTKGNILSAEAQRISESNPELIFSYVRSMVDFYENHSSNSPLPDELRNGIAMCGGIHHVMAEFMRSNGIPAIVGSVNTTNGPHMITIGLPEDSTILLDYGREYIAQPNRFDEAMRVYGRSKRAPVFQSQLFDGNGYMGTYTTAEGRLLHESIGVDNGDVLKKDFLNIR